MMTPLLQMRAALIDEARDCAVRLAPNPPSRQWTVDENAGTVRDIMTGELIVYLDPLAASPTFKAFAGRAFVAT
jgi:hypothetical protein